MNYISWPPFWPTSCWEERDRLPSCLGQCRPGITSRPQLLPAPVLQRPHQTPPHGGSTAAGQHPLHRGSAPSLLSLPRPLVQATPVLPWVPPAPRGEPRFLQILSLGYCWVSPFVLSAYTCVGSSQGEVPSVGP